MLFDGAHLTSRQPLSPKVRKRRIWLVIALQFALLGGPGGSLAGRSCGRLCGVVELDGHGPRHTVADMDSHVQYACNVVVHNLAQKVEKPMGVKRFFLMLHARLLMLHAHPKQRQGVGRVGRARAIR